MSYSFCMAETAIGHEKFGCLHYVSEHENNEDLPHEWNGGIWPPCSECWGLDMHKPGCTEPKEKVYGRAAALVTWKDDQKPKVRKFR